MLIDSGLKNCFWAEAVSTAAYLLNRINCRNHLTKTPEELWSSVKPDMSHIRVFGCDAMVHIPKQKRRKLDPKSFKCILLGYSSESKAYRLYNQSTKKIIISRDVVFLETKQNSNNNEIYITNNSTLSPAIIHNDEDVDVVNSGDELDSDSSTVNLPIPKEISIQNNDDAGATSKNTDNTEAVSDVNTPNGIIEGVLISDDSDDTYNSDCGDSTYVPHVTVELPLQFRQSERISNINVKPTYNFQVSNYSSDPETVAQAFSSTDAKEWQNAMQLEIQSLNSNKTWSLVDLPHDKTPVKCKWVFKTKRHTNGEIVRHKARLVVRGFTEKHGIDYHENFSPVVKYTSLPFLLALAARYNLNIQQMDAVTAFLNGKLEEEIYMCQPEGYNDGTNKVCKLNKSLYGLKQSSRVWNERLNSVLKEIGMKRCDADQCIYYMINGQKMIFVAIYVDDVVIFTNSKSYERAVKDKLCKHFEMKDLGDASSVLGIRITREFKNNTISIDQSQYILEILNKYGMSDCNAISTPLDPHQKISSSMSPTTPEEQQEMSKVPYMQAIGSLLYVSQITRPDICFAVNVLSRFSKNPGKAHWGAVKRVLRYLKGTVDKKLVYHSDFDEIKGYCDADWGSEPDEARSTSGYVFTMQGAAVSWSSKRQATVALSTTEAEFMAMVHAIQESTWLRRIQNEIFNTSQQMVIYCDNKGAIQLGKNNATSQRTKHINIKAHFIKEKVASGQIKIEHIPTTNMLADILTKAVISNKQSTLSKGIGLV